MHARSAQRVHRHTSDAPKPETSSTCPWCQAMLWDREGVEEGVGGQLGGNWDHGGLLCFSCVPPNLVLMSCQAHCNLEQVRIKPWSVIRHLGSTAGASQLLGLDLAQAQHAQHAQHGQHGQHGQHALPLMSLLPRTSQDKALVSDQALGSTAGASQLAGLDLAQTQAKPSQAGPA